MSLINTQRTTALMPVLDADDIRLWYLLRQSIYGIPPPLQTFHNIAAPIAQTPGVEKPPFRIFSLPEELRRMIIGHIFVQDEPIEWKSEKRYQRGIPNSSANALSSCRYFYDVGRPLLYAKNTYHFGVSNLPTHFLPKIGSVNVRSIRHIQVDASYINKTRWSELRRCSGLQTLEMVDYQAVVTRNARLLSLSFDACPEKLCESALTHLETRMGMTQAIFERFRDVSITFTTDYPGERTLGICDHLYRQYTVGGPTIGSGPFGDAD